jgi:4-amino-4-deoxy-L-arabinose transferase-like glycosyltransferase
VSDRTPGLPPFPSNPPPEGLLAYLQANRRSATYLVAVNGATVAAPIILATRGQPVLAMGGFTGTDPAPTVAQLAALAASGQVRFVMLGGGLGPVNAGISQWVRAHATPVDPAAYGGSGTDQLYQVRVARSGPP